MNPPNAARQKVFCPRCRYVYLPGPVWCVDCGVNLLALDPLTTAPVLLCSGSAHQVAALRKALDAHGIRCIVCRRDAGARAFLVFIEEEDAKEAVALRRSSRPSTEVVPSGAAEGGGGEVTPTEG